MRELLKIGPLNGDTSRWLDALYYFDRVHVVMLASNAEPRVDDKRFVYHELPGFLVNKLALWSRLGSLHFPLDPCYRLTDAFMRLMSRQWVREIQALDFDEVLVSYNDFDESAQLFTVLWPAIRGRARITRAYKESRPGKSYYERQAFELADRVVLNHPLCQAFFERDYGGSLFADKEVVFGLDEDFVSSRMVRGVKHFPKLSDADGKRHVVILAGRVFSDTTNRRSGSRLCYLNLISSLIGAGLVVHLHTLRRFPDINGVDQYELLAKERPEEFHIEEPLDFSGEGREEAFARLSRYDYGVMHNYVDGTSNTEFDKYNIPHRYYEYQVAGVVPILEKGRTYVLEDFLTETKSGLVYSSPEDLLDWHGEVECYAPTFGSYIERLYG